MKKYILAALLLIGVILFVSNPSKEDYINWSSDKLMSDSNGIIEIVGNALMPSFIDESTKEENFFFCKIYKTEDPLGNTYKSIGLLNKFIYIGAKKGSLAPYEDLKVLSQENINSTQESEPFDTEICGYITEGNEYNNYQNGRFGFSADYPNTFIMDRPPQNGDGLMFHSEDGKAKLIVSGSNNGTEESVAQAFNDERINIISPSYVLQKDNWYVISWEADGTIHYIKSYVGEGSINTLSIEYPRSQKERYSDIVEHISPSFQSGNISEAF